MKVTHKIALVLAGVLAATGLALSSPAPASALDVNPGARIGQVDVRLTSYETRQAATNGGMAAWYCALAMGRQPLLVALGVGPICAMTLQASAAYALKRGKRAGVTYAWNGWWNWTY